MSVILHETCIGFVLNPTFDEPLIVSFHLYVQKQIGCCFKTAKYFLSSYVRSYT